jgi:multidrug efflux pump subunit AcrA (membrane-fusion protein)
MVGLFLMALTLALLVWAAQTLRGAIEARMNEEPAATPRREQSFAVNVMTVTPGPIVPTLKVFGQLRSQRSTDVRPAAGGTVQDVSPGLVEGGTVRAGELLLRIDPTQARATRDRSAADLQDAEAELRDAERGLTLAADDLAASEAQAILREQALARTQDLLARGASTAAAVEDAQLASSSAAAATLSRRQALAASEARLDQAATQLARARIDLAEADRAVTDTDVYAPFDGVLASVNVSPGGRVSANESIATLLDPSALEVAFRVSTSQYARLLDDGGRLNRSPLTVTLDASGVALVAEGQIIRESAQVGEGQTGRLLFAELSAAPGFRPGDFVTVSITEPVLLDAAILPGTSMGIDGAVLVVGPDDRLALRQTEVLRRQDGVVIVAATGLIGERIVTEMTARLGVGVLVRPISVDDADAEPPAAPELIALEDDRRARLKDFVAESRMPPEVKSRLLEQLDQPQVSSETVDDLESRMGS